MGDELVYAPDAVGRDSGFLRADPPAVMPGLRACSRPDFRIPGAGAFSWNEMRRGAQAQGENRSAMQRRLPVSAAGIHLDISRRQGPEFAVRLRRNARKLIGPAKPPNLNMKIAPNRNQTVIR